MNIKKQITILTLAVLPFLGACSGDSGSNTIFAPIAGALGLGTTNNAFSNDLNDPVSLPGDVAVTQPPQANAGSAPLRGIIALERARLGRASRVDADVSVLKSGEAPRELVLHRFARMEANRIARADSIRLHKRASILGTAEYNDIKLGRRASVADQVTPLGDLPLLPPFLTGTPGTERIDHGDSPLAAGNYGKLKLKKKKTLVLTGGIYHFTDIRLSRRSSLICESTCVLLIKNRLRAGRRVQLSAMSGKSSDLIIYVEGESQSGEHHHASIRLRKRTNTTADIYAPNGKVRVGRHANYTGNLIGKRVIIGRRAHVVTGETVPPRVAKLFRAGEAGVIEIPGEIRLEVPACALNDDTVITMTRGAKTTGTPPGVGAFRAFGNTYDLQPSGLVFNCPTNMTITYDPAELAATGLPAANVRILTSTDGTAFTALQGTPDIGANQARAAVSHFSLFITGSFGAESTNAVVVRGDFAYTASPSAGGLLILNVSDKMNPTEEGRATGTGNPGSIALEGNEAYIANAGGGLDIYDVSDPSDPSLLGTYNPGALLVSTQFTVRDGFIYLPVHGDSVQVLRADGGSPTLLQTVPNTASNTVAYTANNNVYACDATGFPTMKILGGSIGNQSVLNQVNRAGFLCGGIAAANGHLFIVSNLTGSGLLFSNLEIMSITTPDSPIAPRSITTFAPPHPDTYFTGIKVRGRYAFISYAGFDTGTNMIRDEGGMLTLDISNPAAPIQVRDDQFPTGGPVSAAALAIDIDGDYAFVSASGLQILDISAFAADPAPVITTIRPSGGQIFLDWNDVPGAVSYRVYRGEKRGFDVDRARFFPAATSQHINSTGAEGRPRYYVVRAIMAGGIESAGSQEIGAMSSVNWTQRGAGINTILHSIAFGNGTFAAAGESSALGAQNGIYRSTTGSAWTQAPIGGYRGIAFGAGTFLALTPAGANTHTRISADAASWSGITQINGRQLVAAAHGAGNFVAVGFGGAISYSPDGVSWTPATSGTTCNLSSIAWSGSEFVAVSGIGGCGIALRSTDGINWTSIALPRTEIFEDITFGAFQFIAVGFNGAIVASPDGINWQDRSLNSTLNLTAVARGFGYFVALGSGDYAFASLDGREWLRTTAPMPFPNSCMNDLIFANFQYVGVGTNCAGTGEAVIVTHPFWSAGVP